MQSVPPKKRLFLYIFSKCPCHPEPLPIGNYRDEEVEVVEGGMGDYNYMHHGCLEFTIEVCD